MNPNLFSMIPTLIGVICIGLGILLGCLRGLFRNILHVVHLAAAALIAAVLTAPVTALLGKGTVALFSSLLDLFNVDLYGESPNLAVATESMLSAMAAGLWFVLLFIVAFLLTGIVVHACKGKLNDAAKNAHIKPAVSLVTGILLGAFSGFFLYGVLFMPVTGLSHTVNDAVTTLSQDADSPIDAEKLQPVASATDMINRSPVNRLTWKIGQRALYRRVVAVKTDRGNAPLDDEIRAAVSMAGDVFVVAADTSDMGSEQADAITHIAASLGETKAVPALLAGFLSDASSRWMNGEEYFGLSAPKVKPPVSYVIGGAYRLFSTTVPETVEADLLTFADMISSLDEVGLLNFSGETDDLLAILSDEESIKRLGDLGQNDRSDMLLNGLVDAAADAVVNKFGIKTDGEEVRQTFDRLTGRMTTILQGAYDIPAGERFAYVSEAVRNIGPEFDITIDGEQADAIAEKILSVFGSVDPASIGAWDYVIALADPSVWKEFGNGENPLF